ncbi:hypothetical protein RRG08_015741 [Elysia crispata]|uniref:Uncharacterized protein n=1 Tax=Elysia crispata TaxID=231223 RepID=A0AAE0YSN5_9GAST|nr:hypothetical protein RRG08_015741 [Elysia crispata]
MSIALFGPRARDTNTMSCDLIICDCPVFHSEDVSGHVVTVALRDPAASSGCGSHAREEEVSGSLCLPAFSPSHLFLLR